MYELKNCGTNPLGLYEVKEHDTLSSVCEACRVPPSALIARNGLREFPQAGALLVLPEQCADMYSVRAGETAASVCEKFGMSEKEFFRMNGCAYVYPTQLVYVRKR